MAKKVNSKKNVVDGVTTMAQLSADKLDRAVQGLNKVAEDLKTSANSHRELTEAIELKQADLIQMEVEFSEKERQMVLDLQMRAKEESEQLVSEVLKGQGSVSISNEELLKLKRELETLKNDFDKNVKSELHKTVSVISERHESQMNAKQLEFNAETATIKAQLETANDKVESVVNQVNEYKDIINEERKARVEEAKARGGEKVNITTGK